jgi:hypothetical protein
MAKTQPKPGATNEPTTDYWQLTAGVVAGQGIVRRVVLYVLAFALCVSPIPPLAVVPLALLLATDTALA